jgi:uncharacterized protein YukE
MTAMKEPSPLAPFSHDWIGGDIRGLSAFASVLYGYAPNIDNVAGTLDGQVNGMVSAAHWQGAGASAFKSSWDKDSVAAQKIASMAVGIGQIVDELAVRLSKIENALEQNADYAGTHGVRIGSDGKATDPASSVYATGYGEAFDGAVQDAQTVRKQAADDLAQYMHTGSVEAFVNNAFGVAGAVGAEGAFLFGGGGVAVEPAVAGVVAMTGLADSGVATMIAAAGAIPVVVLGVAAVGFGVGYFAANLLEGKGVGGSLDAVGHEAAHLWDDIF